LCQATEELPINVKDALLYLANKGLVKLTGAISDEHILCEITFDGRQIAQSFQQKEAKNNLMKKE
jgi:hypothetical protein